jgi:hypothetical protein
MDLQHIHLPDRRSMTSVARRNLVISVMAACIVAVVAVVVVAPFSTTAPEPTAKVIQVGSNCPAGIAVSATNLWMNSGCDNSITDVNQSGGAVIQPERLPHASTGPNGLPAAIHE